MGQPYISCGLGVKYSGDSPAGYYNERYYNDPKDPTLFYFQLGARQAGIKTFNVSYVATSPRENAVLITLTVTKEIDRRTYKLTGTYYRADPLGVSHALSPCWAVSYTGESETPRGFFDMIKVGARDMGKEFARAWLYGDISQPVKPALASSGDKSATVKPPKRTPVRKNPTESPQGGIIADQGRVLRPCYVMSKADPKATRLQKLNKGDLIWVIDSPNAKWLTVIQGESKIGYVWRECISLKG